MPYICPFCLEPCIEGTEPGLYGFWVHDDRCAARDENMCEPVAEAMGVMKPVEKLRTVTHGILPWEV